MDDQDRNTVQLTAENEELKRRLAALEAADFERRQNLEALRESEWRYRELAESATDIIYVLDRQGNLLYANRAAARSAYLPTNSSARRKRTFFRPTWFENTLKESSKFSPRARRERATNCTNWGRSRCGFAPI